VRRLKLQMPHVVLIAYVALAADRVHHVFDAGRYGFEELVIADIDDGPTTFAKAIEKAGARGVASMLRRVIPDSPNPVARDALMIAVTRAHEGLAPIQLAKIIGVAPRQMARKLAEAGYPSVHRLITWGRLIVAASLMQDTRHSAERTALTIHFPSGSAFRNTCQRYLNATPTEVRTRGGALYVFDALKQEIARPY
jgi:AraC-like DNA-binding protein